MTDLNPEGLGKAAEALFLEITAHKTAAETVGFYWEDVPAATRAPWEKAAQTLVSAYLGYAVVTSVEGLKELPVFTVLRDAHGIVWELWQGRRWAEAGNDVETDTGGVTLPATVLHRPAP